MTDERLIEIESRLAWQDDLLDALNKTVAMQQQQISQMEKICRQLVERLGEVTALLEARQAGGEADETPPHY